MVDRILLAGTASAARIGPLLTGTASALESAVLLEGTAEATISATQWLPVAGVVQNVRMAIYAEGDLVRTGVALFAAGSADGAPSWSGDWPVDLAAWPIRNPFTHYGSTTCFDSIEVRGEYYDRSGALLFATPLIQNGEGFGGGLKFGGAGAFVDSAGGIGDAAGEEPIEYELPPYSSRPRSLVIAELAAAAGAISVAVSRGTMQKPLRLASTGFWPSAEELARIGGQKLYWRHDGKLAAFPLRISGTEPIAWVISAKSLIKDRDAVLTLPTQPATVVYASTSEQTSTADCATVTEVTFKRTYADRQRRYATHQLAGDGTISATGLTPPPSSEILETEIETRTTKRCGTVVAIYEIVRGWKLVETWRHIIDDAGSPTPGAPFIAGYHAGAYFFGTPSIDGNEPCFVYPTEHWAVISETWTENDFDEEGWLVRTRGYSKGWFFKEAAWKTSPTAITDWEAVGVRANLHVTGPGKGVVGSSGASEVYTTGTAAPPFDNLASSLLSSSTTEIDVQNGYTLSKLLTNSGFRRIAGSLAWYADGVTSLHDTETYGRLSAIEEIYGATGEASHKKYVTNTSYAQRELGEPGVPPRTDEDVAGYLPEATRLAEFEPEASATAAPLEVEIESPGLTGCWRHKRITKSFPLAETRDELEFLARLELEEASAVYATMAVPAMFTLRVGQVVFLMFPEIDLRRRARVWEIQHTDTGRDGVITEIIARFSLTGDAP